MATEVHSSTPDGSHIPDPDNQPPENDTHTLKIMNHKQLSGDSETIGVLSFESRDSESESQLSPSFNVETSTTDSGVSNTSSLLSDQLLTESSHVHSTSHEVTDTTVVSSNLSERSSEWLDSLNLECGTVGNGMVPGGKDGRRSEEEFMRLSSSQGPSETGRSENSSRRSSSLDCLEPQSSVNHHQTDTQKRLHETTESTDSVVLTQRRATGRTHSVTYGGEPSKNPSLLTVFKRKRLSYVGSADHTSQTIVAATSTTGLILQNRPNNLPAKSAAEEKRHQKMYQEMVATARKKELQRARQEVQKEKQRRIKDEKVSESLKEWSRVLPNWEALHKTRKVCELWWQGLPPGVRGEVWRRAIGNELNITPELYQISLGRCNARLASLQDRTRSDSNASQKSLNREHSVEVIHLDVLRTFPTLGFFQESGPYNEGLHDVLGAYACYRPDIGYVQGMSFLAAVLLLNMDAADAFICLANLLNRPSYLAFFKVDHALMRPYFDTFNIFLQDFLPKLSVHFKQLEFSPEFYLIEWIFTIYTRTLPLDIACHVWDMFCRDGDSFLFRTALGILRMYQLKILEFQTIEEVGQFLGKLPPDMNSHHLFQNIAAVNLNGKRFLQVLQPHIR